MLTGTPAYLAPEVARGAESGYASDVFSLGSTLYATLEGRPPFGQEPNPIGLLHRVASGQVQPPQHAGALAPLLNRMLSPDAEARPTMAEVAGQLDRFAADPEAPLLGGDEQSGPDFALDDPSARGGGVRGRARRSRPRYPGVGAGCSVSSRSSSWWPSCWPVSCCCGREAVATPRPRADPQGQP